MRPLKRLGHYQQQFIVDHIGPERRPIMTRHRDQPSPLARSYSTQFGPDRLCRPTREAGKEVRDDQAEWAGVTTAMPNLKRSKRR
jgi:hypothetical protein